MTNLQIVEGAQPKAFEKAIEQEMEKHIQHLDKELLKLRTGRANVAMIEDIKVICYGSTMPLKNVAALSAPEATLLVIQPWDKTVMPEIEKALSTSDLGVNPLNDGNLIRIQLPRMSSSRRDELAKILQQKLEATRIGVRNVRKEAQTVIRNLEKDKKISEDYSRRLQDLLQKITDKYIQNIEKTGSKKEEEIRLL
jgi:ribosome recycling factor